MKKKSGMLLFSFALSTLLVVSTVGFSSSTAANEDINIMAMINDNGMMNMMKEMDSPEGQEMMKNCSAFMSSYNEVETDL